MDDEERKESLPLVTYPSEQREVILRHGPSVVLWDHRSRQVSIANVDEGDPANRVCPTCQRPFDGHDDTPWSPATFVSPDYFRLLDRSHEASIESSRSVSPTRLLRGGAAPTSSGVFAPQHATVEEDDVLQESSDTTSFKTSSISRDSFSPGYFEKHFREVRELGRGGFGVVILVKHVIEDHDIGAFALKRIPVGDDSAWLAKILKEVQLLQALNHRNLVQYKHVWLEAYSPSPFAPSVPHAFILQQFCNRGDLQSYIAKTQLETGPEPHDIRGRRRSLTSRMMQPVIEAKPMKPEEVFSFFKDIASGLGNLHENGFVHRDLKPSNCLLHESGGKLICLVSDFGETVGQNVARKSSGATGTLSWCAPEVLRSDPVSGDYGAFTPKSDIFSLGLILHLMAFGRLPYSNSNPFDETAEDVDKLRNEIASWAGIQDVDLLTNLPEVLFASLRRLLSLIPSERPSTDEILRELKQFSIKSPERSNSFSERGRRTKSAVNAAAEASERSVSGRRKSPFTGIPIEKSPTFAAGGSSRMQGASPAQTDLRTDEKAEEIVLQPPTNSSLVRHRRQPRQDDAMALPSPKDPLQLLPPPKRGISVLASEVGKKQMLSAVIKLSIFAVKAWTLFTPCRPLAMRLTIAYPLLCLAAIDLVGPFDIFWASMALSTAHAIVLMVASRSSVLCGIFADEVPAL